MMKDLALDKDIVDVVRTRRLMYFGHVVPMDSQRYPHMLISSRAHTWQPSERKAKKEMVGQHNRRL